MSEIIYDIAVVGAGPSGSTAAYYLNKNYKVLIVDMAEFPRQKACGGCLFYSKDWSSEFENFANIYKKLNIHETNSITFYSHEEKLFQVWSDHLYDKVSRYEMDNLLLKEALKKDNVTFSQFHLKEVKKEDGLMILGDGVNTYKAKKIIGADGKDSVVARYLGNKRRKINQFVNTLEYEIVCDKPTNQAHVFFVYDNESSTAWLLPTKKGYYIGLGIQGKSKTSLPEHLENLIKTCLNKNLIPDKYDKVNTFGTPDPVSIRKIKCSDEILLVGDALGTVSELSGEGIDYGMQSGKLAAKVLNEHFENPGIVYKEDIKKVLKTLVLFKKPPRCIIVPLFKIFSKSMTCKLIPESVRKKIQRWLFIKYSRSNKGFKGSIYAKLENDLSNYS